MIPTTHTALRFATALLLALAPACLLAQDTILVPFGAQWKFLDDGSDQGAAWSQPGFNDASWASGPAELGYGDGDEATVVSFGPSSGAKYLTTYFRTTFSVANPGAFAGLRLDLFRDDGAVVYLNGTEVARDNMPGGAVHYLTAASGATGDDGNTVHTFSLPVATLATGLNTLAVEIHQSSGTSSDISLDLQLTGQGDVSLVRGPYLQRSGADRVTIRWRTNSPADSVVRFGNTQGSLDQTVTNPDLATEHAVEITGLPAGALRYYSVGSSAVTLAAGPEFFFSTHPATSSSAATRIWVLGDSGTADGNAAAVRDGFYAANGGDRHADLLLMLGDNAYNNGTDSEYQAAVFDMYPETLRNTPLWPTLGNHDGASANSSTQSGVYYDIFSLPKSGECGGFPSNTEAYYSFDYGNIHFICLDSYETSRSVSGAMYAWAEDDLAATSQEWIIAFWHHPPYSKGSHNSDTETALVEMRQNFNPLFENYGVDLVLCGHSHSYERSQLIDGHYGLSGTFDASMVVDGGSGDPLGSGAYTKEAVPRAGAVYTVAGSSGKISGGTLDHPVMITNLNVLGSMILDIDGNVLDAAFLNTSGTVLDRFRIVHEAGGGPAEVVIDNASPAGFATTGGWASSTAEPGYFGADYLTDRNRRKGRLTATFTPTLPTAGDYAVSMRWPAAASHASNVPVEIRHAGGADSVVVDQTLAGGDWVLLGSYPFQAGSSSAGGSVTIHTADPLTGAPTDGIVVADAIRFNGGSGEPDNDPPGAPANLSAAAGNGSVQLDWDDNPEPDLASYTVLRSGSSGGPYTEVAAGLGLSTFTDSGLTNGSPYFYVVQARDISGNSSGNSNEASATPEAPSQIIVHVGDIAMTVQPSGPRWSARAAVTVLDAANLPVPGATVSGTWSYQGASFGGDGSATTDASGIAILTSSKTKAGSGDLFGFTVTSLSGANLTYDASANAETTGSVAVP